MCVGIVPLEIINDNPTKFNDQQQSYLIVGCTDVYITISLRLARTVLAGLKTATENEQSRGFPPLKDNAYVLS